jgi:hypothetical protein
MKVARETEERQQLLDYAGAQGIALDEHRAARAVAAGRGSELRERLEELAEGRRGEVGGDQLEIALATGSPSVAGSTSPRSTGNSPAR